MADLVLAAGDWSLAVRPAEGAAITRLTYAGRELLVPVRPAADPNRGFHGGFWMAPWSNRLADGRIQVAGRTHHMPINRVAEGHALHGFLRDAPWRVVCQTATTLTLDHKFDTAPFIGAATMILAVTPTGPALSFTLANHGAVATPMGFGWHPFFTRPAGTRLALRTATRFGRNARTLATDPRPDPGLATDALEGLDTHFAGWDGQAALHRPDGTLSLHATGAWAGNVQIFCPPGADFVCVEPVSHAPNAVNDPGAAAHGAMAPLAPGAALAGKVELSFG